MKQRQLDYNRLKEELTQSYLHIKNQIASNEVDFFSLFLSDEGRLLAEQIEDAVEFSIKCLVLSMDYRDLIDNVFQMLQDEKLREQIPKEELEDFDKFNELMEKYISQKESEQEEKELILFTKEDRGRFLAYLTMAIYSYIDAYCSNLVERILVHPNITNRLFSILASRNKVKFDLAGMNEYEKDPYEFSSKWLRNEVKINPLAFLKTIQKGLSIDKFVQDILEEYDLTQYEKLFKDFMLFRIDIAHGKPAPDMEDFDIDFIKERWKRMEKEFHAQRMNGDAEIPDFMEKYVDRIWDMILEVFPAFAKAFHLPLMAIVYPAFVDQAIERVLGILQNAQ